MSLRYLLTPSGKIVLADEQGRPRKLANLVELVRTANLTLDMREAVKSKREGDVINAL